MPSIVTWNEYLFYWIVGGALLVGVFVGAWIWQAFKK